VSVVEPDRSDESQASEPLVCATCGARPDAGDEPTARLTWSRGTDGDAVTWTCERCSREHLRAIEGKLDPDWW
jgi:hypothetical protein